MLENGDGEGGIEIFGLLHAHAGFRGVAGKRERAHAEVILGGAGTQPGIVFECRPGGLGAAIASLCLDGISAVAGADGGLSLIASSRCCRAASAGGLEHSMEGVGGFGYGG